MVKDDSLDLHLDGYIEVIERQSWKSFTELIRSEAVLFQN